MSNIGPKEKVSRARRDSRKANWKINTPAVVECPHCHEMKAPHVVCPHCGYYNGVERVAKKDDKETK